MDKQEKEKFKQEKTELLDSDVLKLEQEITYIQNRHDQKMTELGKRLEDLKFQKEIFINFKIK